MATITRRDWALSLFFQLQQFAPLARAQDFVVAWMQEEGGDYQGSKNGAKWNPLNTTQNWPGATNYNSAGVKNYLSYMDGIQATAAVLNNGLYNPLYLALANNSVNDLGMTAQMSYGVQKSLTTWADGPNYQGIDTSYVNAILSIAHGNGLDPNPPSGNNPSQISGNTILSNFQGLTVNAFQGLAVSDSVVSNLERIDQWGQIDQILPGGGKSRAELDGFDAQEEYLANISIPGVSGIAGNIQVPNPLRYIDDVGYNILADIAAFSVRAIAFMLALMALWHFSNELLGGLPDGAVKTGKAALERLAILGA